MACGVGGCVPDSRIVVDQPHLAAAERRLSLDAHIAAFATRGGVASFLVELPLPGAQQGWQYQLYLRAPDASGTFNVGDEIPGGGFVAGFFIQRSGRHRGLTELTAGAITISGAPRATPPSQAAASSPAVAASDDAGPPTRTIRLAIHCGDGTSLSGIVVANRDDRRMRRFESASSDVTNLIRAAAPIASQPAGSESTQ